MTVGALMLTFGPTMYDMWSDAGIYLGIAAAELLCIVLMTRLPDVRRLPGHRALAVPPDNASAENLSRTEEFGPSESSRIPVPAAVLIAAMLMLSIGNAMVWTFAGSISAAAGLTDQFAATFLGLSQLLGLVGAGITLALGAKVGKMVLLVPALLALAIGNFLAAAATGSTAFIVGFVLISLAYYCVAPLLLALAAELDRSSGRLVVVAGACVLLAGSAAPAVGGWIAGPGEDWSRLGVTAMLLILSALPLLAVPVRAAKKRLTATGEPAMSRP